MIWWGIAGLLVLAGMFLLPLLSRRERVGGQPQHADRRAQNVALFQGYRDELESDPRLGAAQRQELLAERGRALLDDVATLAAHPPKHPHESATADRPIKPVWALVTGMLVIGVGSIGLYQQLGQPQADALLATAEILELPALAQPAQSGAVEPTAAERRLRALTARVRAQASADPEDAGTLYLLGIGELKLGAYGAAASAFAQASALVGEDLNLDLFWLQARFFADAGRLTPATQTIADRVLRRAPNQPLVLELLSIAALQEQRFDAAVGLLNRALAGNLSLERRQALSRGFETARQSLGVKGRAIDVGIELTHVPPQEAVLFVIARPIGGGIPYAVVRRPAIAIPEKVRLDDAVSMNPSNLLSSSVEIEVLVRLSLSGEARAAAGDWEWRSGPLEHSVQTDHAQTLQARLSPPQVVPASVPGAGFAPDS